MKEYVNKFLQIVLIIASLALSVTYAQTPIIDLSKIPIFFKDLDGSAAGQQWRRLSIQIQNNSGKAVDISNLKLRYTISDTNMNLSTEKWYYNVHNNDWSIQGGQLSEITTALKYKSSSIGTAGYDLVIYFASRTLPIGGVAEIQLGVHNSNWTSVNENNDPSYIFTSTYVLDNKISLELVTTENKDSDEDGVPDIAELAIGQNPLSKDRAALVLPQSKWTNQVTKTDTIVYTSPYNTKITAILPAGSNNSNYCPVMWINDTVRISSIPLPTGEKPLYCVRIQSNLKSPIDYPLYVPPRFNLPGYASSASYSIYHRTIGGTTWEKVLVDSFANGAIYSKPAILAGDYVPVWGDPTVTLRTIFVKSGVSGGDGSSWTNAFGDLQPALTYARSVLAGTDSKFFVNVFVAKGKYVPSMSTGYDIPGRIHLYGGFAGDGTSQRDFIANRTILEGHGSLSGNAVHVLTHHRPNEGPIYVSTVLDGFTIEGGCATNVDVSEENSRCGGGFFIEVVNGGLQMTIQNCTFRNNQADDNGGAICVFNNAAATGLTILDCLFENNISNCGGAIALIVQNTGVITKISRCVFNNNSCHTTLGPYPPRQSLGGAIYLKDWDKAIIESGENRKPEITQCSFVFNSANQGGAIYNSKSSCNYYACVFTNNSVFYDAGMDGRGDALAVDGNDDGVSLFNCTLAANKSAGFPSAGIYLLSGTLHIQNSVLYDNGYAISTDLTNGFHSTPSNNVKTFVSNSLIQSGPASESFITNDLGGNLAGTVVPDFADLSDYLGPDNKIGTLDDGLRLRDINSLLYNTGTSVVENYQNDLIGQIKDIPGNYDIGAYWVTRSNFSTVDFVESPDQQFGFDRVTYSTSDPTTADIYISLAKNSDPVNHPENSTTQVNVVVQNLTQPLFVRSSSESVFKIQNGSNHIDLSNNVTAIPLFGQDISGKSAQASLDVCRSDGSIVRSLKVKVYEKLSIPTIDCYFIKDSHSANTSNTIPVSIPTLSDIKNSVNGIFKQAVTDIVNVGGNTAVDLQYDLNGNGILDNYNGGPNPEVNIIDQNPIFTGDSKIAVVGKMRDCWRLKQAVPAKDYPSSILLESTKGIVEGQWYLLGPEGEDATSATPTTDMVMFYSLDENGKAWIVSGGFKVDHPIAGQVLYPMGTSLCGLSSDPQIVSSQSDVDRVVAHEMMHRFEHPSLGGLSDVKENDNLMVYMYNGGYTRLRYRDQTCVNTGNGVENGIKEGQWDKIHRIGYAQLNVFYTGGNGSCDALSPWSGLYKIGATLGGEASAADGYRFVNWTAQPSAAITFSNFNSYKTDITLNSDADLYANFAK